MSDLLVKLARSAAETADELKLGTLNYALTECADALEAKDVEIARLRNAAKSRLRCPEGHRPGESRGACWFCDAEANAAEVVRLRQEAVVTESLTTHLGTISAECHGRTAEQWRASAEEWFGMYDVAAGRADKAEADFKSLAGKVMGLPEYEHTGLCLVHWDCPCNCYAENVNAARAAARLIAGGERPMKLYAVTLYREGQDPCERGIHKHERSRAVAEFEAVACGSINGYLACVTAVDVGAPTDALVELANNPDWLNEQPRTVVK